MIKWIHLTVKELRLIFRDRAAVMLMLVLPLALTFVTYFAFGSEDGDTGPELIPVVIANSDEGQLGQELLNVFSSDDVGDLVSPSYEDTFEAARSVVDRDEAAAAVLIPSDFSSALISSSFNSSSTEILVYANPASPLSAAVIQSICSQFVEVVNAGMIGTRVSLTQLVTSGRISTAEINGLVPELAEGLAAELSDTDLLSIELLQPDSTEPEGFSFDSINMLDYYAPSLAILGLMFTLTTTSRSILAERETGTYSRFQTTPSSAVQFLGGKIFSTVITGWFQMGVLILITSLLLDIHWGAALPLLVHTLLLVTATAALGILIASFSRTHAQAGAIGTTVTLILSAASGNFLPRQAFPDWLQQLTLIGPGAWGIEGFQDLIAGAGLAEMSLIFLALAGLSILYFGAAVFGLRRKFA